MPAYLFTFFIFLTVHSLFAQPLSGIYTIGGNSPDFTTINAAVNTLEANGISGPVVFNVRSGIYETNGGTERALHISQFISGASATNTVTFQTDIQSGANAVNVVLRRSSGADEPGWVAYIRSSFITLKNLTFDYANNDTTISGVDFFRDNLTFLTDQNASASIDNIVINGCRVISSVGSQPRSAIKFVDTSNNILIENSFIEGAGDGIHFERCNFNCAPITDITIRHNKLLKLNSYLDVQGSVHGRAIYIDNGSNFLIAGNNIDYEWVWNGLYGIYAVGSEITITGNSIKNLGYQGYPLGFFQGITLKTLGGISLIKNNMITNLQKDATGIYLDENFGTKVYNNTVVLSFTQSVVRQTALVMVESDNIELRNNLLLTRIINAGNNSILEGYGTNENLSAENNCIYSEPFRITFNGVTYDSLETWQADGYDTHSRSFFPEFVTPFPYTDPHLGFCSIGDERLWGVAMPEVATDFDGDPRDPQRPYIGADEVDTFRPDVFSPFTLTPTDDTALSFTAGDLNNDGVDEIIVVNTWQTLGGSEDISIFWNDGNGNFSEPTHLPMGIRPEVLKVEDVDRDGFPDLIATTEAAPVIRWGLGGGNFSAPFEMPDPGPLGRVNDIAFIPWADDHAVWILAQTHFGTVGVDSGWVSLLFHANRTFSYGTQPQNLPKRAGAHPSSIIAADLNNDGRTEFVVNDWLSGKTSTFLDFGLDSTQWQGFHKQQEISLDAGSGPIHNNFSTADIDGDNNIDIVISKWVDGVNSLSWLRGDGAGNFSVDAIAMAPHRPSHAFSLLDYDLDGDTDIISATSVYDFVLYINNGITGFQPTYLCNNYDALPFSTISGRFNDDLFPDAAVLTADNDVISIFNQSFTVGISDDSQPIQVTPQHFRLAQNYPNPFNPATTIRYHLPRQSKVSLKVYDVLGREVAALIDQRQLAGTYEVRFEAHDLASGVYFYRLATPGFVKTRKMLLVR